MKHKIQVALTALLLLAPALAKASDSAVIVMYHRFGEGAIPSTNIRLDQFEAHLKHLKEGGYRVLPLSEIASALAGGKELPEKAVAITIDDAYLSVYKEAWPRLKAMGFPFTLFVTTKDVDGGSKLYMSWEQMREMARAGVAIGNHSATHPHMADLPPGAVQEEFQRSQQRFKDELGLAPDLMAYPYGEASLGVIEEAKKAGFSVGFGQHSGVAHLGAPLFYLPRFALNEHYGDLERFRRTVDMLALPVTAIDPPDPAPKPSPKNFRLTLKDDPPRGLNCYTGDGAPAHLKIEGKIVTATLDKPFPPGRGRLSCTAPAPNGRWRWFGHQVIISQ
ncbi:MAG: polysaccharide deacetylase family protein [Alphaproteobacteria bacterium]|nr:polysaccharide deacetylase family protein [Alphaproteobacteria bacterium]